MTAQIIDFPAGSAATPPIAQFIRLDGAHTKIGELLAANRFPATRVVLDASRTRHQKRLIEAFHENGIEVVLDPQVAELASFIKFQGLARHAPWGVHCEEVPLGPEHFAPGARSDVIGQIARFAVEHGFDAVLAPTHFLADPRFSDWFDVDRRACIELRAALDREGGTRIRIDYPVIHAHTALTKADARSRLLDGLTDLPIDNLWVRASGLPSDARPLPTKQFLTAMASLHNLGKPVIVDHLNGLVANAALAFGIASGKAHGIGERERFDARNWHKPQGKEEEGTFRGRKVRIPVPGIGRTLTRAEIEVLASARYGKRLVACGDRSCCANGLADMIADPRRHQLHTGFEDLRHLAEVPALMRPRYFLDSPLNDAVRRAREIQRLKPNAADAARCNVNIESLMRRMHEHTERLEKLHTTLEHHLEHQGGHGPRVRPAAGPRVSDHRTNQHAR